MSDQVEKYQLLFDTSNVEEAELIIADTFNAMNTGFHAVSVEAREFNRVGALVSATIKAIGEDGKQANFIIGQTDTKVRLATDGLNLYNTALGKFQFTSQNINKQISVLGINPQREDEPKTIDQHKAELQYEKDFARLVELEHRQEYEDYKTNVKKKEALEQEVLDYERNHHKQREAEEQRYQNDILRLEGKRYKEDEAAARQDLRSKEALDNQVNQEEIRHHKQREAEEQRYQNDLLRLKNKRYREDQRDANEYLKELNQPGILGQAWNSLAGQFAIGNIVSQGFFQITGSIREAISSAMEFERTMGRVAAVGGQFTSSQVLGLSSKYGIGANEVANAAFKTVIGGAGRDSNDILNNALKFNVVFGQSTESAVKMISNSMEAFGAEELKATDITNEFFKVFQKGNVNQEEFASMFGNLEALGGKVGLTFKELTASVSALGTMGVNTSNAMKYLQNILNLTLKPSKELQDFFNSTAGGGTGSFEGLVKQEGFIGALTKLFEISKSGNFTEVAEVLNNWRTATGLLLLQGDGLVELKKRYQEFADSTINASEVVKNALDNDAAQIEIRFNKIKNSILQYGKDVLIFWSEVVKKVISNEGELEEKLNENDEIALTKRSDALKKSLDGMYKDTYDHLSKVRGGYADNTKAISDNFELMQEGLRIQVAKYREDFELDLHKMEESITHFQSLIKGAESSTNNITKTWEREDFESSLEGLSPITKAKREQEEARRINALANLESQKALSLANSGDSQGAEDSAAKARSLYEEARGLVHKAEQDDKEGVKKSLELIKNAQIRDVLYRGAISHQTLFNNLIDDEKNIRLEMLDLNTKLIEDGKKQLEQQKQTVEETKRFKVELFESIKSAESTKIGPKDDPTQIANKIKLLTDAQDRLLSNSTFGLGETVSTYDLLQKKIEILRQLAGAQEKMNDVDKETHTIDEQKKQDIQTINLNTNRQVQNIEDFNRSYGSTIELFKTAAYQGKHTAIDLQIDRASDLSSKLKVLDSIKNYISEDIKNHPGQFNEDELRRTGVRASNAQFIGQHQPDFLQQLGGTVPNQTQTVNSNNNNTLGPINITLNGINDGKQAAEEIGKEIGRLWDRGRLALPNILRK